MLLQARPGTSQWLLTDEAFIDWLADPTLSRTLWLVGIPGSSKTTLASILIDRLERDYARQNDVGIVYEFCDYSESNQTGDKLKRMILRALSSMHCLGRLRSFTKIIRNNLRNRPLPSSTKRYFQQPVVSRGCSLLLTPSTNWTQRIASLNLLLTLCKDLYHHCLRQDGQVCSGTKSKKEHTLKSLPMTKTSVLKKRQLELLPEAHRYIIRVCIQYLLFRETSSKCTSHAEWRRKTTVFPLLACAASSWGIHFTER